MIEDYKEIIINAIGLIACALTIYSFQRKETSQIFFTQIFCALLWCLHFFLLGAYAGSIINIFNMGRKTALVYLPDAHIKKFIALYLLLIWGIFFSFIYNTPTDLFPLIANLLGMTSFFIRKSRYMTARFSILIACMWMSYGIVQGSYPSIITEIFIISSIFIGMIRHERKPFKLFRLR